LLPAALGIQNRLGGPRDPTSRMGPPADDVHGIQVEAEVRQEGCTFAPHVVLLAPGE